MSETVCTYPGNREEALIAYLYEDVAPAERMAFESHVATCNVCHAELTALGAVRARMAEWATPEPTRALTLPTGPRASARPRVWASLHDVPVWMQVAAAMLFLGVSAGAANLDIRYNADGLSIRTGWSAAPAQATAVQATAAQAAAQGNVAPAPAGAATIGQVVATEPSVSRDELLALERQLRSEIGAATTSSPNVVRQVRALIADSERKQENELAFAIARVSQDFQTRQQADLVKVDRSLGALSNITGQQMQRLAVRFSQKQ